jgi:hypothetical protein
VKVEIGCRFDYLAEVAVPAVAIVEPHASVRDAVLGARWDGETTELYEDIDGNRCRRLVLPPGSSSFSYFATVRVSPEQDETPGPVETQHLIEDLPSELLRWLLPSRFCESDTLGERAWELFGDSPRGAERVQAVCDWIHENIKYGVPTVPTTTASEVLSQEGGMCRDFAHLGITFCRALGIPARYVSGYLPDIGIAEPDPEVETFHAWCSPSVGSAASRLATSPVTCSERAVRMRGSRCSCRSRTARFGRFPSIPHTTAAPGRDTSPWRSVGTTPTWRRPQARSRGRFRVH